MTAKMDRRTFLKTTAAAVVAVSMSGMLTGCGDVGTDTDFGGYTARVVGWDTVEHPSSLNSSTPWWAEFKVEVYLKNLDKGGWDLQCKQNFQMTIDGQTQPLMKGTGAAGDLPSKDSWLAKLGSSWEPRRGYLNFKMTDRALYQKIADKKAEVCVVIGGMDVKETYTLDYTTKTFVLKK